MPERIGILGGAFDPPHVGHLILGETARQQLPLDRVLFLPTGEPPHKRDREITSACHRLAMTKLATLDNEYFDTRDFDIERPVPHYTSTLRPYLEQRLPGADLFLIIGGDSLSDLPAWHQPQVIVEQWRIAALPRPQYRPNWHNLEKCAPGIRAATTLLDGPSVAISSTQIRQWIRAGRGLRYLVPTSVGQYIREHRLYTTQNQT